jgi:diadenosine tetraphosphatase ApaH/serine/threonine PP2A family protein phosphatase
MARTIAIGDVHGCLEEFQELLKLVSYRPGVDTVVQVGDLMDRGPDPVGCVRFAREQNFKVIRGNHECKHIRWRKHESARLKKKNPVQGINGLRAEQNLALSDDDIQWLNSLPLMIRLRHGLVAVHAGLEPAFSLSRQSSAVCRVRYVDEAGVMVGSKNFDKPEGGTLWSQRWRGPESVVYGHAVHSLLEPRIDRFGAAACYGIDTGCVFGGSLCAAVFIDGSKEPEFVLVRARRVYYESRFIQP